MVQAFDHRAARIVVNPQNLHRPAQPDPATLEQHRDPDWLPVPQFWVLESETECHDAPVGGTATTIQGPPTLSVADAEVDEGPDAGLEFTVTLNRRVEEEITVGYRTEDGTATAMFHLKRCVVAAAALWRSGRIADPRGQRG